MTSTTAPSHDLAPSSGLSASGSLALFGGLLWIAYGFFEFLSPWGIDAVYDEDRGYEVVTDRLLFTVYTGTGALALLVCCLALLATVPHSPRGRRRSARTGRIAGRLGVASALAALAGVVVALDPLATGMRVVGSLLLGAAALAAAWAMREQNRRRAVLLATLGTLGLLLLPLWPLVYAVQVVPAGGGTAVIAGFGLMWLVLGRDLLATSSVVRLR